MLDDNKGRVILKITESGIEEAAVCADTPEQKKAGLELLSVVLREIAGLDEALKMIASIDDQPTRKGSTSSRRNESSVGMQAIALPNRVSRADNVPVAHSVDVTC